jgi:hypothetical protein
MLALALLAVLCAGVLAVETFKKAGRSSRMGEPQLLRLRDRHVADFAHEPARGQL